MRNALIAKIHIAKKSLGLDDDTYRLVLEQTVKKKSTKQCSELQLIKVLNVLKEKGFKPAKGRAYRTPAKGRLDLPKIYALWALLQENGAVRDKSLSALDKYCRRMTGIDCVQWLDEKTAQKLIECLKQWFKRIEKGEAK